MQVFRQLFQEYVKGNFHVALMALVFCELTFSQWGLSSSYSTRALVFLLTFLAYNGIRYFPFTYVKDELARFYFVLFTVPSVSVINCEEGHSYISYIAMATFMMSVFVIDLINLS